MTSKHFSQLQAIGFFGPMDIQVADLAARMVPEATDAALLAAALASRAISLGHACTNLADYAGTSWREILSRELTLARDFDERDIQQNLDTYEIECLANPPAMLEAWIAALPASLFGKGDETGKHRTILIQKDGRVYLRRYWGYENTVERKLVALNHQTTGQAVNDDALLEYFQTDQKLQQAAARNAVEHRLSLLSGGPGTGKTYTLARAVALLGALHHDQGNHIVVRMVAPTGKAAVRMVESIKKAKQELRAELSRQGKPDTHLSAIPEEASTIHRLLGSRYHSPYFKHDATNPLQADLVIVDEASMVDLPLMAKLLDALPENCALMLVGDTDQLASVEPGRVYGDVCHAAEHDGPLAGSLTRLTKSWRFPDDSVIGTISRMVNAGNADAAWEALQANETSAQLQRLDAANLDEKNPAFRALTKQQLRPYMEAKDAETALSAAANFRILCALRNGRFGVNTMNRHVENILSTMGLVPTRGHYDHQLIMIKVNTPELNLFNGDVGVILAHKGNPQALEAWFPDPETGVRALPVGLLPEHETAFAMTIHKSQGSEFPNVALILPDHDDSPILTRELLYTGITRVAINPQQNTGKLTIWCSEQSFKTATTRQTFRSTGLFQSPLPLTPEPSTKN